MLKRCFYALCAAVVVFLSVLVTNIDYVSALDTYSYKTMWPALQQSWYFNWPYGTAVDSGGNVYVAEYANNRIQKFTSSGQFIAKWGSEGSEDGQFDWPAGITVDSGGNVYVAEYANNRIQKFTSSGQFIAKWGSHGTGDGQFDGPVGIAVDSGGNVYVGDWGNSRIQKFTSDGRLIAKWGSYGTGDGQFDSPSGIAIDSTGYVYVIDYGNNNIQKFTSGGQFIAKWGSHGTGDGQFDAPEGIAIDSSGNVYVAESSNNRIQKFTSDGTFITKWGSAGQGNGQFNHTTGITSDILGNVYVADTKNSRLQKFTLNGTLLTVWGSQGTVDGQFYNPWSIAKDSSGNVYVADGWNNRIQKFTSSGTFITKWGNAGQRNGQFSNPFGIAIDLSGNVYVTDYQNHRIQKFTSDGQFIINWGSQGSGKGQFNGPEGIAIDSSGNVYVIDTGNNRIQKFTSDGQFITKWGIPGTGDGQFNIPEGIAIDSSDNVYVAESSNNRIQKFTSDGTFVTKWGSVGGENGQFNNPAGMAVDSSDNIYVADRFHNRIQKFTSGGTFIAKVGSLGSDPGQLSWPVGLTVTNAGDIYVADSSNNRIQVFTATASTNATDKAIIVAGSGPYPGNNLWDATQLNANFAWRTLSYQGYTKDTIYYLSYAGNLEPDGNGGYYDIVNASPSNANLKYAITTWAQGANDVVIYITGHGGPGTFKIGASEILNASDLATWLNTLQSAITGKIIFIYDACYSGSFIPQLVAPSGRTRINVTSASSTEEAAFASGGSVSFSYFFWGSVFNGAKVYNAYSTAKNSINLTYAKQNALIDDDGDGIGGEKTDGNLSKNVIIGNGNSYAADFPTIGSVSQPQTLNGGTTAKIRADNVTTTGSIQRVWAIVTPPNFTPPAPGQPITNQPTFDFISVGGNAYEGSYGNFTVYGTYNIAIFVLDDKSNLSLPLATTVTQTAGNPTNTDPQAAITANGSGGTVNLKISDILSLKISLNPGSHANEKADWWLYALTTAGNYYFDVTGGKGWTPGYAVAYQGALFNLPSTEVLNIKGLPAGSYTFSFGVDLTMDGKLTNPSYTTGVTINVSE
ncbi:MAG: hypothetical protein HQK89_07245 [Nitrospirae bacterium]|nr:hypothetical protein [Nitrospirota bacterium]